MGGIRTVKFFGLIALGVALCVLATGEVRGAGVEFSPVGNYVVEGWNNAPPKTKADYTGTAKIWSIGTTFLFEADLDGQRYTGVALWDNDRGVLGLQFNGTDGDGLTLLRFEDNKFSGPWVFGESPKEVGWESWTPTPNN